MWPPSAWPRETLVASPVPTQRLKRREFAVTGLALEYFSGWTISCLRQHFQTNWSNYALYFFTFSMSLHGCDLIRYRSDETISWLFFLLNHLLTYCQDNNALAARVSAVRWRQFWLCWHFPFKLKNKISII